MFNRDPQQQPGKLVRYGYPRDKDLLQHEYLTAYNLVIQRHPDLLRERTNLQNERKHTPKDTPRYVEISKRLMHIRNNLDCEEKRAVQEAKFVATTVSKAVADKTIYDDSFDVVIFDEASMAYIPQIVFSAKLAKKHFICMGDFAQLPPIVQAKSNAILNMDIFEYCGITEAVRNHNSHEWLCLLDTQYRMHPDIANFSSMAMCQSLLKSASDMEIRRKSISNTSPLMYYPLGLADLTGMMSVCTQTADSSRINPLSALVSFGLALKSAEHHDVGIITPYHAQSRLFHAMARDALGEETELHTISCATVHQFQGSEKDIIIYDAVDCYRQRYHSALLTSTSNNYASRLFNVALTRARGKFIAVANIAYMESKNLSHDLMFTKLIDKYKYTARCLQGKVYYKEFVNYQGSMYAWLDEHQGEILFIDDIKDAKSEIRIDIPGEIKADNAYIQRISHALCLAQKRGIRIIIRAEDRNKIPQSLRPFSIQNSYVANAISIIDKKIVWFGEPLSSANFVSGENIIPTKYRPIIRFKGRHTAMSLYGFLEMNRTIDDAPSNHDDGEQGETFAQYIASHSICEICGKPMRLKKSKGFFLGCSGYPKCNHTEKIDVDFVEEYFRSKGKRGMRCPQCNCSLEATRGQYGVYIRCCGLNRHRYRFDEV